MDKLNLLVYNAHLYDLSKTHKTSILLRPTLSMTKTPQTNYVFSLNLKKNFTKFINEKVCFSLLFSDHNIKAKIVYSVHVFTTTFI